MKPVVILIAGLYGAGKSTLCAQLADLFGRDRAVALIFDTLTDNDGQPVYETQERWQLLLLRITESVSEGRDYTVAEGSFHMRETRERFVTILSSRATVHCLFFMVPVRTLIKRLNARTEHPGRITRENYTANLRRYSRSFIHQDNTDLLLPSDRAALAPEYRAAMRLLPQNRELFDHPDHDAAAYRPWLVITDDFDGAYYASLLMQGITDPLAQRVYLERRRACQDTALQRGEC